MLNFRNNRPQQPSVRAPSVSTGKPAPGEAARAAFRAAVNGTGPTNRLAPKPTGVSPIDALKGAVTPQYAAKHMQTLSAIAVAMKRGLPAEDGKLLAKVCEASPYIANRLSLDRKGVVMSKPLNPDQRELYRTIAAVGGPMGRDTHLIAPLLGPLMPQKPAGLFGFFGNKQRTLANNLLGDPRIIAALKQDPHAFGAVARAYNVGHLTKDAAFKLLDGIGREPNMAKIVRANPRPAFFKAFSSEGFRVLSQHLTEMQQKRFSNNPRDMLALAKAAEKFGYDQWSIEDIRRSKLQVTLDMSDKAVAQAVIRSPQAFARVLDGIKGAQVGKNRPSDTRAVEDRARVLLKAMAANPAVAERLAFHKGDTTKLISQALRDPQILDRLITSPKNVKPARRSHT